MSSRSTRLQDHFADLTDPRRRKVVYPLINVVTIAICAVVCGATASSPLNVVNALHAAWRQRGNPGGVMGTDAGIA